MLNINAEKSISLIYLNSLYHKYNRDNINEIIKNWGKKYNEKIDDANKFILSEVNRSLDKLREKPTGSGFWNFIAKSARDKDVEIQFYINPKEIKFDFDEKKLNINSNKHNYGILLEFSTNQANRIGTHIFLTNKPGIDIFYARNAKNMQLAVGLGVEFILHDIQYDEFELALPYIGIFGLVKFDYYFIHQDMKIFIMYKFSKWPIIGQNHAAGFGISMLIK